MAGANVVDQHIRGKATFRLTFLSAFFALASFVWGFNVGILSTLYVHPGFKKALHKPKASQTGLITAIYYLGTWLCYIFISQPANDYLGRRYAASAGLLTTCVGSAIQASAGGAHPYAMMIIGRIICGFGLAIVSTSVPLYQSEIAPAKQRGRYVVMNHIGMVAGLAVAFWVGYAFTFWETGRGIYLGWRLSVAVQYIPAIIFLAGIPFCPETPRWLILKGKYAQAERSLRYLRAAPAEDPVVEAELAQIRSNIETYVNSPLNNWKALFTNRSLFNRLWRAGLLHFMAQICGATGMKYYLPGIFISLGLGRRLSLMIGGIESTLKIACTITEMFLIDRFGRRATLIVGCIGMGFALLINGALPQAYPKNINHAADYACIVFIFIFTFSYSLGFGPAAWVYGSEIFPTNLRSRGLNLAASGGSIGSIIAAQVWPVGFDSIGSKTYFIFMAINFACAIIVWALFPETKHRSLEDMDALFDTKGRSSISPSDVGSVDPVDAEVYNTPKKHNMVSTITHETA